MCRCRCWPCSVSRSCCSWLGSRSTSIVCGGRGCVARPPVSWSLWRLRWASAWDFMPLVSSRPRYLLRSYCQAHRSAIVIPVLADAGQSNTALGQLIIAGSSIADFGAIILLSLFFSGDSSNAGSTLLLIGGFVALVGDGVLAHYRGATSEPLGYALSP